MKTKKMNTNHGRRRSARSTADPIFGLNTDTIETLETPGRSIRNRLTGLVVVYLIALPSLIYLSSANWQLFVWTLGGLATLFCIAYVLGKYQSGQPTTRSKEPKNNLRIRHGHIKRV